MLIKKIILRGSSARALAAIISTNAQPPDAQTPSESSGSRNSNAQSSSCKNATPNLRRKSAA